jgi:hypothetical protein
MLRLTDDEMTAILTAAQPIDRNLRDEFLRGRRRAGELS